MTYSRPSESTNLVMIPPLTLSDAQTPPRGPGKRCPPLGAPVDGVRIEPTRAPPLLTRLTRLTKAALVQ
nr:MAG TPA: hypothetical protein [Caudoviricetes sp.]